MYEYDIGTVCDVVLLFLVSVCVLSCGIVVDAVYVGVVAIVAYHFFIS